MGERTTGASRAAIDGGRAPFETDNPAMVVLAYLWLFCIVPLVAEKDDRVVRWHALTGLVLVIAESVGSLVFLFSGMVLNLVFPAALVALFAGLAPVIVLGIVLLHGILLVDALNGRRWEIPIVTRYVKRISAETDKVAGVSEGGT